jgi:hypothetical protein
MLDRPSKSLKSRKRKGKRMFDLEIQQAVNWMMAPLPGSPGVTNGDLLAFFAVLVVVAFLSDRYS